VQLAQRFEKFWGRRAQRHLCVTRAMQARFTVQPPSRACTHMGSVVAVERLQQRLFAC